MSAVRVSQLFRNGKQVNVIRQNLKSTMVYQVDKTAAQKLIDRQVAKNKELQKFWAAEDGMPLWWKTPTDKFLTTFLFAGAVGSFVVSLTNCIKFANGTL